MARLVDYERISLAFVQSKAAHQACDVEEVSADVLVARRIALDRTVVEVGSMNEPVGCVSLSDDEDAFWA